MELDLQFRFNPPTSPHTPLLCSSSRWSGEPPFRKAKATGQAEILKARPRIHGWKASIALVKCIPFAIASGSGAGGTPSYIRHPISLVPPAPHTDSLGQVWAGARLKELVEEDRHHHLRRERERGIQIKVKLGEGVVRRFAPTRCIRGLAGERRGPYTGSEVRVQWVTLVWTSTGMGVGGG